MASTKYTILVEADLDGQTSQNVIQKKLNAVANIVKLELKNVTLSKQALDGMKAQIVSALQGIKIPGGAAASGSPSTPSAQKTLPAVKTPPASKTPVAPAPPAVADVANAQRKLQTALRDTNKEMRISWEYTRDMTSGMVNLNGAVVTYTDTAGKERKERYGWVKNAQDEFEWINKSGSAIDDKTKKLNLLQKAEAVARSSELKQNGPGGGTSQVNRLATETAKLNTLRADLNAKVVSGAELSSEELRTLKAQTAEVGKAIHEVDLLNKSKATTKKADDEIIKKQKDATAALEKARGTISSSEKKQIGQNSFAPEVQTLATETAKLDVLYKSISSTAGGLQNVSKAQLDSLRQQTIEVDKASKALDISLTKEKQMVTEQEKLNSLLKSAHGKADVIPKSAGMDTNAKEVQEYNNALKNLNASLRVVEESIRTTGKAEDWMIQEVKAGQDDLATATANLNRYSGALKGFNAEESKKAAILSKIDQTSSLVQSGMTKTQGMDNRIREVRNYNTILNNLRIGLKVVQDEFYNTGRASESLLIALEENKRALVVANGELDRRIKLMREQEKAAKAVADEEKRIADQIAKAQKTLDSTNALTTNKSGSNRQVREVIAANKELALSIENITELQRAGKTPNDAHLNALEQARIKSEKAGAALRSVGKDANSWAHEIEIAIKRTIEWAGAMTLLYGSLRQIQLGIEFIRELNKEMTSIQIVSGATEKQMEKLAYSFNDMAKTLGTTTKEVAQGSLEWIRQGKTIEETTQLLKNSTMMSKLANLEAAQATEYMTSIMNGFQLQAEDMAGVLDTLVALDNAYATSVGL